MKKLFFISALFLFSAAANSQSVGGIYGDVNAAVAACREEFQVSAYDCRSTRSCPGYDGFSARSVNSQAARFCYPSSYNPNSCPDGWTLDAATDQCFEDEEPDPVPETMDGCIDAILVSGNGAWVQDSSGSWDCQLGDPDEAACSTAKNSIGTGACMTLPESAGVCSDGYVYGEFNNSPVCVESASSNNVGTSEPTLWGTTTDGESWIVSAREQVTTSQNENNETITTTTNETTTATDIERIEPNDQAVPIRCDDGRLAADLPSCDSNQLCPPNFYLVYGSCVAVPSEEINDVREQTTTTTTRTNETTNVTTTETSDSTTYRPGGGGGGSSSGGDGETDGGSSSSSLNCDIQPQCSGPAVECGIFFETWRNRCANPVMTEVSDNEHDEIIGELDSAGTDALDEFEGVFGDSLEEDSGLELEPELSDSLLDVLSGHSCTDYNVEIPSLGNGDGGSFGIECSKTKPIRDILGFGFAVLAMMMIYGLARKPVER